MRNSLKISLAGFLIYASWGCTSTEILNSDRKDNGGSEGTKMFFDVRSAMEESLFDDGTNLERKVETLYVVFYDKGSGSPVFRTAVKGTSIAGENLFRIDSPFNETGLPDYAIGIANYGSNPGDILNETIDELENRHGFIMSSATYFDENKEKVFYSEINAENLSRDDNVPTPVILYLERLAAKATVSVSKALIDEIRVIRGQSEEVLKLTLTGWTINATDSRTYVMKKTESYEDLAGELGENGTELTWQEDDPENGIPRLHWAHSLNYFSSDFPSIGKEKEAPRELIYQKFSDFSNFPFADDEKENAQYFHETTRRESQFEVANSLPMLVVAGYYRIGNSDFPTTFYLENRKEGKEIFYRQEYFSLMSTRQDILYKKSDSGISKLTAEELEKITIDKTPTEETAQKIIPPSYVCLQLKEGTELSNYCNRHGEIYKDTDFSLLNTLLYQSCGLMQKFNEGQCVFLAPVIHFKNENEEKESAVTGDYGLIRNNYYAISISQISGIGNGIADKDMTIGDFGEAPENTEYTLGIRCRVIPWHELKYAIGE